MLNNYDYLTGLPSISYFLELAEKAKGSLLEQGKKPVLIYTDLSGMKYFNHRYGFAEGDNLLRSFAEILSRIFNPECCCHVNADHFAAFTHEDVLEEKLATLFKEWDDVCTVRKLPVCVGIYQDSAESVPAGIAYDRAKIACDAIKGNYTSQFNYYSHELSEEYEHRQYIIENFDKAIAEKWIQVYYQPIVRPINMKVCDDEALARWIDPVKGFLSPAEFIPTLEEAGLIYKLDLYVLDRVLENMNTQKEEGLYLVPHSINLSRYDFEECDIVEEVKRRVDAAGIDRKMICVELTESVIGKDFEFMKEQVERFQKLGFPVWMDDFGSGYSSLDVLHSIRFDLIKFDMNFMRKLDENEDGRIILTELMKMAIALGLDTICEGVETEGQARFLQEIGCSKHQGFFYSKPMPFEQIMEWHKQHKDEGYENPEEDEYYDAISGLSLFNLGVIASDEEDNIKDAYNTIPMGIIEIKGDSTRFLRTNQSYRDFFKRAFKLDISKLGPEFVPYDASFMFNVVKKCCEQGERSFYDEKLPDGSVVHSFAKRIGRNTVIGCDAVAIAVLSISEPNEETTYVDIARALAADYYSMYVVDLETDKYIEYSSPVGGQVMAVENHGEDFFESSKREAERVYEEDRELFYSIFNKEQIIQTLEEQSVFTAKYRLMDSGKPMWMAMKITRLQPSRNRIIIGVSLVDAQMKKQEHQEELQRERATMTRVMALSDKYLTIYTVDPETNHYVEFSSSEEYGRLKVPNEGEDFFAQSKISVPKVIHPDDLPEFEKRFSKENIMKATENNGPFVMRYRLIVDGIAMPVKLKAVRFMDGEKNKLLIGVRQRGDNE